MDVGNYLASGGVSGAVIAGLYLFYKCCYKRKFHSKCCGGEMDIGAGEATPPSTEVQPHFPTPKPSPALAAQRVSVEIPPLVLDEAK
jgi:hypothetical protein